MRPANWLRLGALALTIFAGVLAGCGGGGSVPHSGGGSSQGTLAEGTLHIVVPEKTTANGARRPAYISPSTTQLVWSDGGSSQSVALTTANPDCSGSGSGLSCTVNFYIAPGTYTFSFTLEDGSNKPLSAATSVTKTLTAGAATTLSVTLGGIAQSFSLASSTSNFATPSSGSNYTIYGNAPVTLTINALDADQNIIVGSGSVGVSATLSPVPTASASAIPATATFAAGSSNTWTLTSTYHATSPSIVGSLSLVVSASPYPGSGVTQTLTQTYNLQFYTPWLIVSQSGSSSVLSYDEQGNAQSLAITGVPNPSSVVFGPNSSTASPLPSPYLYVAAVTTATPVPTPTGTNTVGPSSGAIKAYNGDGSTPALTGSFSGVGVPVGLAFDTNLNYLYALNGAGTALQAFDAQGNSVSISAPTIGSPTGIVFDNANDDLYVSTTSGVFAYTESGASASGVSAFAGVSAPSGIAYDSNLNEIAVLNGNGTVALYAPTGGTALVSFPVISSPTAIVFDPYSLWFYVANSSTIKAYGETGALQTLSGAWSGLSTPTGITVVQ